MDCSKFLTHKLQAVHCNGSTLSHSSNFYFTGVRPDLVPIFGLPSTSLSVSFPNVSESGIADRSKDTGWWTKCSVDETNPGLMTRLLKVTLCPLLLPAMGIFGTWGRWSLSNTSTSLISLPLFFLPLCDTVLCCLLAVPWMTLQFHPSIGGMIFQLLFPPLSRMVTTCWNHGLLRQMLGTRGVDLALRWFWTLALHIFCLRGKWISQVQPCFL